MAYSTKVCLVCGKQYIPNSSQSKYCSECGAIVARSQIRNWCAAHPESVQAGRDRWIEKHREEEKTRNRMRYLANPDLFKERARVRRLTYPEDIVAYNKTYKHPPTWAENHRRSTRKRFHQLRAVGPMDLQAFYAKCDILDWQCQLCGKQLDKGSATIDHIIPISKGGTNATDNLQPLCKNCNCKKGTRTMQELRQGCKV